MKHGWFFVCCAVLLCLTLQGSGGLPAVFRLQVVAADDTALSQAQKLAVKNRVVAAFAPEFARCGDVGEVYRAAQGSLDRIEEAAQSALSSSPLPHEVQAEVGVFPFPEKQYRGTPYPAGSYRALRITLDEGQGHNWWCMLYPPLCLPEGDTQYRSLILDLLGLGISWKGGANAWEK